MYSGRPSSRPSVTRYLFIVHVNADCHRYSSCEWALLKDFQGQSLKGQGREQTECCTDGGMHFDAVTWRVACFPPLFKSEVTTCVYTEIASAWTKLLQLCQESLIRIRHHSVLSLR